MINSTVVVNRDTWYPDGEFYNQTVPLEVSQEIQEYPYNIAFLLPPKEHIPNIENSKWKQLYQDQLYSGIRITKMVPMSGIRGGIAWTHLLCIARSMEPHPYYREAAFLYLINLWFEDIKYEVE